MTPTDQKINEPEPTKYDVVIVGAGFAGLYMLHRVRELGLRAIVYEAGEGIGGTWHWNRYPGARCDIETLDYCFTFSEDLYREWDWTERYPRQDEILGYINYVADKFDLRKDIQLETRVTSACFDEVRDEWQVRSDRGDEIRATFCVMATGCLSVPRVPEIRGSESFLGAKYHTGVWPREGVDFTSLRVGVIGTGSSGIQSIPQIAQHAEHLYVFQRTASFTVQAQNRPVDPSKVAWIRNNYAAYRDVAQATGFGGWSIDLASFQPRNFDEDSPEERRERFEQMWQHGGLAFMAAYGDLTINKETNDAAAEFIRSKIRDIVHDPTVAETLCPKESYVATKRLCVDIGYFETYNRPNVTLVDIHKSPISEITPTGITTQADDYELDAIVFATGFDAMTGALLGIDIRGRGGRTLAEAWAGGPRSYLGLMVAGFPNLYTVTGPGSPSVLSNMVVSIEQHVDWIKNSITHVMARGATCIEAETEAQDRWVDHVNDLANATLFPTANSWYLGANIPGKPRVFMPYVAGLMSYREKCDEVVANDYEGFKLTLSQASI